VRLARRLECAAAIDKAKLLTALTCAMFRALSLTLGQIGDTTILRVIAKSLALTLVIFVVLAIGAVFVTRALVATYYGWGIGVSTAAAAAAGLAVIVSAWLLFRAVAIPVIGLFADEVVAAIEARHYPAAAQIARPATAGLSAKLALASLTRLILLNLLAVPLYGVLLFTAIGPLILFLAINALLLGRDLGEMVAVRHLDTAARKGWLRVTRGERAIMGAIVTGIFMIPIINLIAPIVGAGMATHLFHRGQS
jgi:CysZ protein